MQFKPHLQLISASTHQFHLVLNNGTALYHLVVELCTLDQAHAHNTQANPFAFTSSDALSTALTLLHDTRDCWHALAEGEIRLVHEPLAIAPHPRRAAARLVIRSTMKFDAEQYLSALVKRMVRHLPN